MNPNERESLITGASPYRPNLTIPTMLDLRNVSSFHNKFLLRSWVISKRPNRSSLWRYNSFNKRTTSRTQSMKIYNPKSLILNSESKLQKKRSPWTRCKVSSTNSKSSKRKKTSTDFVVLFTELLRDFLLAFKSCHNGGIATRTLNLIKTPTGTTML